jgi:hypothetical protein
MAIQFTEAEKSSIMDITQSYSVMMKRSVELSKIIEDTEETLVRMASDMDQLKQNEHEFFHGLATKYDVELRTVENAAANYAINPS